VGEPIRTTGEKAWHSVYSVQLLGDLLYIFIAILDYIFNLFTAFFRRLKRCFENNPAQRCCVGPAEYLHPLQTESSESMYKNLEFAFN